MKVAHVITGLGAGGAEHALLRLIEATRNVVDHDVHSLIAPGELAAPIEAQGVVVRSLGLGRGQIDPRAWWSLARQLRRSRADVVQTWMYHADLLGGLAARSIGHRALAWNIRHTDLSPERNKASTLRVARLCARISRFVPRRIVCCAEAARLSHVAIGYDASKFEVIPNGYDTEALRPRPQLGSSLRTELGIDPHAPVVGLLARFHPQKDHRNFLLAAARLVPRHPGVRFVLCGDGIDAGNAQLRRWIEEAGLGAHVHLLGPRDDVPALVNVVDVGTLSSRGEGFPNTLAEFMASGVPCAATDVGDTGQLLGDTGLVVPPGDPSALAEAISTLLSMPSADRLRLGERARARVVERYSAEQSAHRYRSVWESIASERSSARAN